MPTCAHAHTGKKKKTKTELQCRLQDGARIIDVRDESRIMTKAPNLVNLSKGRLIYYGFIKLSHWS